MAQSPGTDVTKAVKRGINRTFRIKHRTNRLTGALVCVCFKEPGRRWCGCKLLIIIIWLLMSYSVLGHIFICKHIFSFEDVSWELLSLKHRLFFFPSLSNICPLCKPGWARVDMSRGEKHILHGKSFHQETFWGFYSEGQKLKCTGSDGPHSG